jgi:hypothetical protein
MKIDDSVNSCKKSKNSNKKNEKKKKSDNNNNNNNKKSNDDSEENSEEKSSSIMSKLDSSRKQQINNASSKPTEENNSKNANFYIEDDEHDYDDDATEFDESTGRVLNDYDLIDFDHKPDLKKASSKKEKKHERHRSTLKKECSPPPPNVNQAKLDLLNQVKLYLQLIQVLNKSDLHANANNTNANANTNNNENVQHNNDHVNFPANFTNESSTLDKNVNNERRERREETNAVNNGNIKVMDTHNHDMAVTNVVGEIEDEEEEEEEEDEDEDEEGLEEMEDCFNLKLMNNRIDRLKPLIPYCFYSDSLSYQLNEPFIGRDWIFKQIDRVYKI